MNLVIIGNALCFIGSLFMVLMGFIKEKKKFLLAQSGMNCFFIAGNLCLGGISGAIANLVTLTRNMVCIKWKFTKVLKIIFIALQIGLTAAFGVKDVIMWLPIIGNCVFTYFLDTENMVLLKSLVVITQAIWGIYDCYIMNFATVPFDIAAVVTNAIAIAAILKQKKTTEEKTDDSIAQ